MVVGGVEEEERLSSLLKSDMIQASDKGDVEFINKVIVPILHAEKKIPISISLYDSHLIQKGLQPVY
jgi:hypothetical protein